MRFVDALADHVLLFDGAFGTQLQARGFTSGECPEAWNRSHPEAVQAIHQAYAQAGSDIVETNSLGGNRLKLAAFGLADQAAELTRAAVANARAAGKMVALSIGPSGAFMPPLGTLSFAELYAAYREQAVAAEQAGADLLLFETMTDLAEARVGLLAAKENTSLPVAVSFTFEHNGRTLMGNPPEVLALLFSQMGADMVGMNCSGGPDELYPIFERFAAYASAPIHIMPNAGLPQVVDGQTVFPVGPEEMAEKMQRLLDLGPNAIGGCCGTTPEHIARMAALVAGRKAPQRPALPDYVCSARQFMPLAEALEDVAEVVLPAGQEAWESADALSEASGEASCVLADVSALADEGLAELMQECQQMVLCPMLFACRDMAQARALLPHYHGLTAVRVPDPDDGLLARYGARAI